MIFDQCVKDGFGHGGSFKQCEEAVRQRMIFWDGAHPSTKAQCWIGYWMQLQMHKDVAVPGAPDLDFYEGMCSDVPGWRGVTIN